MNKRKEQGKSQERPKDLSDMQLLRISEVAAILSVGRSSVYRLIQHEGLPTISLGSRGEYRVARTSLRRWMIEREAASHQK